jgi:hypothetical protein
MGAYYYFINQAAFLENSVKEIIEYLKGKGSSEVNLEEVVAECPKFGKGEESQPSSQLFSQPSSQPFSQPIDRLQLKHFGVISDFLPLVPATRGNKKSKFPQLSRLLFEMLTLLPMDKNPSITGCSIICTEDFKSSFLENKLSDKIPQKMYDLLFPNGLPGVRVLQKDIIPVFLEQMRNIFDKLKANPSTDSAIESNPKYLELKDIMQQLDALPSRHKEGDPPIEMNRTKFTELVERMSSLLHNSGDPEYKIMADHLLHKTVPQDAITLMGRSVGEFETAVNSGFNDYLVILVQSI